MLMQKFPFLHQYAYLNGCEQEDEFTNYVNSNLVILDSMHSFTLSAKHVDTHNFVEKTFQHFFCTGMAVLINDTWKDSPLLTS